MNIVLKKTLHGLFFGAIGSVGLYAVFFFIELFSFLKSFFENSGLPEEELSGSVFEHTLANFTPMLSVWSLMVILFIAGGLCFLGMIIGLIIGCVNRTEHAEKVSNFNNSVIEDGSKRQKILFAKEIKTMAESIASDSGENLHYMKNIVETEYITGAADEAIMSELVKFIGYEQTIKELMEYSDKEGV